MKPLSIYIHIPFCLSKCYYCDFNSCISDDAAKKQYLKDLYNEMKIYGPLIKKFSLSTIFIGGGTPTSLSDEDFEQLLAYVHSQLLPEKTNKHFIEDNLNILRPINSAFMENTASGIEYTVEVNPNSVSAAKAAAMKKYSVSRVSLGMQTSDPDELSLIGRTHAAEDVRNAVTLLKSNGITDINIDLMYAIPSQTMDSFSRSLDYAISLSPSHISCYSLILEPGTRLYDLYNQGLLDLPSEDADIAMYEMAIKKLREAGYIQYEISNFSRLGYECRHNIAYWELQDYLGLGLSAHSYVNDIRFSNTEDIKDYHGLLSENKKPVIVEEYIDPLKSFDEWIFLKLRMNKGIDIQSINEKFGIDFTDKYSEQLTRLNKEGLLNYDKDRLYLTVKGFELSNYVFLTLLT